MAVVEQLPPAIFVMGPTASGKTDLAIALSKQLPCELISVDSALVYRGMDIGTAKPDAETLRKHPHHLIDLIDPAEAYSAASFRHDALRLMADITARGRIPLLVGGTMMYFKILLKGMSELPAADPQIRAAIEAEAAVNGWAAVHRQLHEVDPESATRIHATDPQRLQRALEVYRATGISMTEWRHREQQEKQGLLNDQGFLLPYKVIQLALWPNNRALLHDRIALRFEIMLQQGMLQEVAALKARGDLNLNMPSMRSVGYRQVWQHLDGELDYEQMVHKGVVATRQLAKRQLTWLRGWPDLHWIATDTADGQHWLPQAKLSEQALKLVETALI